MLRARLQKSANTIVSATSVGASSSNGRVSVSAKVKVEDRYVFGTTYLPKITTGPTGVVVVGITISHSGSVTSARVKTESTISDEDTAPPGGESKKGRCGVPLIRRFLVYSAFTSSNGSARACAMVSTATPSLLRVLALFGFYRSLPFFSA